MELCAVVLCIVQGHFFIEVDARIWIRPSFYNDMNAQHWQKAIIHLDMDAFYPSVEVLDNPSLGGKAVIVGGSRKRGVVSSASYEARQFGVHSAQPIAKAMRLCPHGVFLPVRMDRYREMSHAVFRIFAVFTPLVEPVSIDEAFLDVTGSTRLFGPPETIAKTIKKTVREMTGLTISAGIAPSKFIAKIASDVNKPDGLTLVRPEDIRSFLDPLPIEKMWGVGKKTQRRFHDLGIQTIQDLRRFSPMVLEKNFGRQGMKMRQLAQGIDEREVVPINDAKSVGNERTFSQDIRDTERAKKEILALAEKVARRLRRKGVVGSTITLKVKYSDFVQVTRSESLQGGTSDGHTLFATACDLMRKTKVGQQPVRLLGISVSNLTLSVKAEQLGLFHEWKRYEKKDELNKAIDALKKRFGEETVQPATLIRHSLSKIS